MVLDAGVEANNKHWSFFRFDDGVTGVMGDMGSAESSSTISMTDLGNEVTVDRAGEVMDKVGGNVTAVSVVVVGCVSDTRGSGWALLESMSSLFSLDLDLRFVTHFISMSGIGLDIVG